MTASGSVSDFDEAKKTSLRTSIAVAGSVDASAVTVTVAAASVLITATIAVPASTTAAAVQTSLSSTLGTAAAASDVLGITVESDPTIAIRDAGEGEDEIDIASFISPILSVLFAFAIISFVIKRRAALRAKAAASASLPGTAQNAPVSYPNAPQPQQQMQQQQMQMGAVPTCQGAVVVQASGYPQQPMAYGGAAGYPQQPAAGYPQQPVAMGQVIA